MNPLIERALTTSMTKLAVSLKLWKRAEQYANNRAQRRISQAPPGYGAVTINDRKRRELVYEQARQRRQQQQKQQQEQHIRQLMYGDTGASRPPRGSLLDYMHSVESTGRSPRIGK